MAGWSRADLELWDVIQKQVCSIRDHVGADAAGANTIDVANELLRAVSDMARRELGLEEQDRKAYARSLAESLRPFAHTEDS
jgi:hypothetical protein